MADTDQFSRHLPQSTQVKEPCRLVPDANFSRNVTFHVIRDPNGDDVWSGRYLLDLLEVAAECHPQGLLVEIDGIWYRLVVAPAERTKPNG